MKIKEILNELLTYYNVNRGVGHTTLMKKGVDNYDGDKIIVCYNYKHANAIGLNKNDVVTIHNLKNLRGIKSPIIIDNAAMVIILQDAINEIEKLEKEIEKIKKIK